MSKVLKGILWVFAFLIFLQNLGYNISTLLAGIGIGGVAIAFALQSILEDVFSYFSIYFDKPFVVGDFLDVGGQFGTVSYIGIKSTRLTTLQGEELVIPNQTLTSSNVHNYKKMKERRIQFSFGILYETPVEKVKKVLQIIKEIVDAEDNDRFDRAHFNNFGDSSLDFEVVYFMLTDDYKEYMNTQQSINLKMLQNFAKEKIEFAYPTRTVLVKNESK
ncbi:mechanosensitive ion channel family protein [bacterium]|nr:mechanosensitive ion channel family protein [bacterium]